MLLFVFVVFELSFFVIIIVSIFGIDRRSSMAATPTNVDDSGDGEVFEEMAVDDQGRCCHRVQS